jgi:hypothetical protein
MQPIHTAPNPFRLTPSILIALLLIALGLIMGGSAHAADGFAGADLGVAPSVVGAETRIHTSDGTLTGPAGVETYVASLRQDYPGLEVEAGTSQVVGGLIIVDWQGTIDGDVVFPGRTLITVEHGAVTEVMFLNRGDIAPESGVTVQPGQADPTRLYVIVDEQGNVVAPEM